MAVRLPKVPKRFVDAARLPELSEQLAWQGAKLLALYALTELVRRIRAGPLTLAIDAPLWTREGEAVFVETVVESPHPLRVCEAYFGGAWQPGESLAHGVHREKWLFHAGHAGLRPILVRARDSEGHVLARTRWIVVLPGTGAARRMIPAASAGPPAGAPETPRQSPS